MTPQVKSDGFATMMKVVEKERNVPMIRTQLSSRLQARTTGVFQNFQRTPLKGKKKILFDDKNYLIPAEIVVMMRPVPAKNIAPSAHGLV